jgi:hypothetical protein
MIDENLLYELRDAVDTRRVQAIADKIDESKNVQEVAPLIEELQTMNNALYEKTGFSTLTLDFQVYINSLRTQYDVPDPREVIHTDNGKGFVQ